MQALEGTGYVVPDEGVADDFAQLGPDCRLAVGNERERALWAHARVAAHAMRVRSEYDSEVDVVLLQKHIDERRVKWNRWLDVVAVEDGLEWFLEPLEPALECDAEGTCVLCALFRLQGSHRAFEVQHCLDALLVVGDACLVEDCDRVGLFVSESVIRC